MNQVKLNFFEQIYYAVMKPRHYYRLTKASGARLTGFVFLFSLLTSLFTIIPMFFNMFGANGFTQYLREDLPEFELSNGELYVENRYENTDDNSYILIDTDIYAFDLSDVDNGYDQSILISRSNMVICQSNGRMQVVDFSDLRGLNFDNTDLNALVPFLYVILFIIAIFIYLFTVGRLFLAALLYSLLGMVINSTSNINMKYEAIYKTAIYSQNTISIVLALIKITPLELPVYVRYGVGILVTCAYVVFGTLSHASDEAYTEAGFRTPSSN